MDLLTYLLSRGAVKDASVAAAVAAAVPAAETAAEAAVGGIVDDAQDSELFDRKISFGLLLNYVREHEITMEHGTVTLTNTLDFPFNDSKQTVSLVAVQPSNRYAVITRIASSTGNAGEVEVSDKLVNGFKLNTTGGASSAVVEYIVIGGYSV